MKKNIFLLNAILLLSTVSLSLEGNLKISGDLNFNFKSQEDDTTTKVDEKGFYFSNAGYNLGLVDLKLSDKETGISFGGNFKSSRVNILVNDWDNEQYNKIRENKSLNHDVQGKVFVNWKNNNENLKFGSNVGFEYYLDNYARKSIRNGSEIAYEDTFDYEYIDGDKKYLGGDTKFNAGIYFKPINNLKIGLDTEYYANNIVKYQKGYPTFKNISSLNYDINENQKLEFKHNFNLNLRSFALPYKEEKENEDNEQFVFLNNFVRRYRQEFDTKYTFNNKEDKYSLTANFKDHGYLIAGPNFYDKTDIDNHRLYFDIDGKAVNNILGFKLSNSLLLSSKYETINYLNSKKYELWANIKPKYVLDVAKDYIINDFKLTPNLKYSGELVIPLTEGIYKSEYLINNHTPEINLEWSYSKDKLNVNSSILNKTEFKLHKYSIIKITGTFEQKGNVAYDITDKLNLKVSGQNKMELTTINDVQKRIYLDTIKGNYGLKAELGYKVIDNEDEKFDIASKIGFNHEYEIGYILDGGKVPYIPKSEIPKQPENPKINDDVEINFPKPKPKESSIDHLVPGYIFKGDLDIDRINDAHSRPYNVKGDLLLLIQQYVTSLNMNYTKKFDKFTLKSGLDTRLELDLIALTKEKKSKLRNTKEDDEEKRIELQASTQDNFVNNIGGKIEFKPSTSLKYDFTDKLSFMGKIEVPITISKKVINKITDKKRSDEGTYGPKDREFKLRKISPKFGFELNYTW